MKIEITGRPLPWKRFGICRGRIFDRQAPERASLKSQLKAQYGQQPSSDPLMLSCEFVFEPAASLSAKKREALIGKPHMQRPDADNLLKLILDAGNGILWADDKQIVELRSSKRWGERDYTSITFEAAQAVQISEKK